MSRDQLDGVCFFGLVIGLVLLVLVAASCQKPKLVDVMPPDGVKCKAEITMPDGERMVLRGVPWDHHEGKFLVGVGYEDARDAITVDVRIYDCK